MGRVDDAMRRAAEAAGGSGAETPGDAAWPAEIERAAALAAPLPIEISEARRRRNVAPAAPETAVVADVERVDDQTDTAGRAARAAEATAILDRMDPALREKVVVDRNMDLASREQYRRLAATLYHQQADAGLKVLMIASAGPSEGKTLTTVNLGLTLSESYRRSVLLIDADLRRPSLHTAFGVEASPGLTEGLAAGEDWKMPLHQITSRLTLLTGGQPSTDPMFGLTSSRMRRLIDEARETFTWVIIDTPPVGLLTDASLLASMVDGALLLVKASETSLDQARRAIEALGPGRLIGVVLNRAAPRSGKYGQGYEYSRYYARPDAG